MMRRRKKGLSAEDRELWDRVKRSTSPLARSGPKAGAEDPIEAPPAVSKRRKGDPVAPESIRPFQIGDAVSAPSAPQPRHDVSDRVAQAPIRMKQTAHRRMIRGKMKPEARIDLHGMTLSQAHPALVDFVIGAHARDLRLLLVITGKGRGGDREDDGPIPIRRGVLKQQVPGWLTAPPLGALVLEIREAHPRHGGGGAFYVYLRRSR
jgi:DNA-nicking Smr family endonuclease